MEFCLKILNRWGKSSENLSGVNCFDSHCILQVKHAQMQIMLQCPYSTVHRKFDNPQAAEEAAAERRADRHQIICSSIDALQLEKTVSKHFGNNFVSSVSFFIPVSVICNEFWYSYVITSSAM